MISIKTIEKYDDCGRQFRIVICFRDLGRLRAFVNSTRATGGWVRSKTEVMLMRATVFWFMMMVVLVIFMSNWWWWWWWWWTNIFIDEDGDSDDDVGGDYYDIISDAVDSDFLLMMMTTTIKARKTCLWNYMDFCMLGEFCQIIFYFIGD